MVNTELRYKSLQYLPYYNILNIVVNTEQDQCQDHQHQNYNILNIVVNTEQPELK